ncbi:MULTISPECIES: LysR family transcriptional regulator [Streptomyces]|jgi:DNA-binding transcriptional LysR family regulator|uniref:LysR family transcriptional regulator n=1 Tax=Streptomyces spinosisporus TaxID=2927582 RepID=A0ABS9XI73_9ACTN|nr:MULTISPECIES: LysR family transcriptional regulator [Streptomyces]MCI3241745.1 LysR family transcriptional regulator [Streptomyces spinosisporus]WUB33762.1 LysR family transcriptional regulator [Streptomyces sp. NBC_00588]
MLNLVHLKVLAAVARHESVTEAARELHYSQPSVSHHLSRLEAATGVKLVQRAGRGIRLTPEGRLLANRAAEIVGRVDAATNELAAQVGLQAGRVRLAANASTLSTIVPRAATALGQTYPGIELSLIDRHPVEALQTLRHGEIDIALVFRYADAPAEDEGFRLLHIGDDAIHLISRQPDDSLANHRDSAWIGGCAGCQAELSSVCRREGFTPRIASLSDDMVVVQSLVAAGIGVAILPGLALRAHRRPDVHATELTGFHRRIYAATYGDPPDPPAVAAVLTALAEAALPAAQL